ncbi:hypothetical protein Tco_0469362 [Tanacetum coccineum]
MRSGKWTLRHLIVYELDYGITDTWDDLVGAINEIAPTTLEGVNQRVTDLSTIVEQETTIMYGIIEDARDDRNPATQKPSPTLLMLAICTFRCYVITNYCSGAEWHEFKVTVNDHRRQKDIDGRGAPGEAGSSS